LAFFAVHHTGIDSAVIKEAYAESQYFFKKDSDFKIKTYDKELKGQRGFVPGEFAKGNTFKDCKEFFVVGPKNGSPKNVWPDDKGGFERGITDLYDALNDYVIPLQQAIIETINQRISNKLPLNFLNDMTKGADVTFRVIYYPALSEKQLCNLKGPLYWAAPHTDIDLLAILPYATEKGLQVEIDGEWLTVVVPEDAIIVNVGDMLENLTNGLFVSARHRVMAQEPDKDRFSMVLFVHPTDNTPLDPIPACIELTGGVQHYAPGTRNEFLWERLIELDIGPTLLEAYSKTGHTERQLQYGRESPQVLELILNKGLASEKLIQLLENKNKRF
jgi:isopenicillin N synthase-like dioxygenase